MNETMFISDLRSRLISQGVSDSDADKYAEQFRRYFDNLTEDEISEQIVALGSMDDIVGNLLALIRSKREKETESDSDQSNAETPTSVEDDSAQESAPTEHEEGSDEIVNDASAESVEEISEASAPTEKKSDATIYIPANGEKTALGDDEFISAAEKNDDAASSEIAADEEISALRANRAPRVIRGNTRVGLRSDSYAAEAPSEEPEDGDGFSPAAYNAAYNAAHCDDEYIIESETRDFDGTRKYLSTKKGRLPARGRKTEYYDDYDEYYDEYEDERSDFRKYIYKGPKREWAKITSDSGKKRFWGILLGTLPITVPLAAIILVLFCAAFLALWAVIAALILALAAITVIGSAFSLIANIYGITQLFTSAPIGIYEIGVGIASAGITMLVGILVYNADVRAMPYAIRYLIKFFFYTIDRVKGLIYRFREECAKIK